MYKMGTKFKLCDRMRICYNLVCSTIHVDETQHNQKIEEIAKMMAQDGISADEQDTAKLQRYKILVMSECSLGDTDAMQFVYEALLYRKLKNSNATGDPLQKGSEFGAGFS